MSIFNKFNNLNITKYLFININRVEIGNTQFEYILIVASAPDENTHGCIGWKVTPKIPKSLVCTWSSNLFNGTINGFFSRSLEKKEIDNQKEDFIKQKG